MTEDQRVSHYVEMWKQSVAVQMHFNDIEWRIRALALTAATFALGAAGVAAKDATRVGPVSLGALIVVIGLTIWFAFYYVDRHWYHPLLKAAVKQAEDLESHLEKHLPGVSLTKRISERSPQPTWRVARWAFGTTMHSDDKLKVFYALGGSALALAAVALQISALLGSTSRYSPDEGSRQLISATTLHHDASFDR